MKLDLKLIATTFKDVEFFLACVNPLSPVVSTEKLPETLDFHQGTNFWTVSSKVPGSGESLVTPTDEGRVLFRGYESEVSVHSYSSVDRRAVSLRDPSLLNNGVFAYLKFGSDASVTIRIDAFGVAPLFYRHYGSTYFFASHPSLLLLAGDEVNLDAWLGLMQAGYVLNDETFYKEIMRFPAGSQMSILDGSATTQVWFDFADLPPGNGTIDDSSFAKVEAAYKQGFKKCLQLLPESVTLPFSSGYDSRRFFAYMRNEDIPFTAVTCQTFHRKGGKFYDIDSFFAPKIASAFGVDCTLVNASDALQMSADSERRMLLIGTETLMHDWAIPLMGWLRRQPKSIVIDGLAGDTLGNSGFEFDRLHESFSLDTEILSRETVKDEMFKHLAPEKFSDPARSRNNIRNYLEKLPATLNRAELAFLQLRTRRCISPWITMMHPPGHVIVFPYYDMGFVKETLSYHPGEKYKWFFQKECLRRSYPEYFDFPGSRNLPANLQSLDEPTSKRIERVSDQLLYKWSVIFPALRYLNVHNKILLLIAPLSATIRRRRDWLFKPLLMLQKTRDLHKPFLQP